MSAKQWRSWSAEQKSEWLKKQAASKAFLVSLESGRKKSRKLHHTSYCDSHECKYFTYIVSFSVPNFKYSLSCPQTHLPNKLSRRVPVRNTAEEAWTCTVYKRFYHWMRNMLFETEQSIGTNPRPQRSSHCWDLRQKPQCLLIIVLQYMIKCTISDTIGFLLLCWLFWSQKSQHCLQPMINDAVCSLSCCYNREESWKVLDGIMWSMYKLSVCSC